jgi:hypothetical protein
MGGKESLVSDGIEDQSEQLLLKESPLQEAVSALTSRDHCLGASMEQGA